VPKATKGFCDFESLLAEKQALVDMHFHICKRGIEILSNVKSLSRLWEKLVKELLTHCCSLNVGLQ
jgi:hypothetical protein